jgi:hypothetical protein
VKVVTVEAGLGFPHAAQGIQIVRRSRPITPGTARRTKWRTETVYAICTLSAAQAQPRELARWLRGHGGIENRLHATSPSAKTFTRPGPAPAPTPCFDSPQPADQ